MNTARKGSAFVYAVRDWYRARGWFVCKSAASLGADLVCLKTGFKPLVIECKAWKLYGKERDGAFKAISRIGEAAGAVAVFVEKDSGEERGFKEIVLG